MLLSDLLRAHVHDADGRDLGSIDDVLLAQDGPYVEGFGDALRVEGLVVGHTGLAVRLGYHRTPVAGPWLVRAVFETVERRARYVPWSTVTGWDGDVVVISAQADELEPPPGL